MDDLNKQEIGHRIKNIRQKLGLSMEDFGNLLDTSKGAVNNWEKGKNLPNNNRLKKISELGNFSIDELLYGSLNDVIYFMMKEFEYYPDVYSSRKDLFTSRGKDRTEATILGYIYDYANYRRFATSGIPMPEVIWKDKESLTNDEQLEIQKYYDKDEESKDKYIFQNVLTIAKSSNANPKNKLFLAALLAQEAKNMFYSFTKDNKGLRNMVLEDLEAILLKIESFIYVSDSDNNHKRNKNIDINLEKLLIRIIESSIEEVKNTEEP